MTKSEKYTAANWHEYMTALDREELAAVDAMRDIAVNERNKTWRRIKSRCVMRMKREREKANG